MANTLTGLIPILYRAMNIVSRHLVGMIPAVTTNTATGDLTTAAKDQTVRVPIAGEEDLEAITPGNTPADSGDQTGSYVDIVMDNMYAYPIRWQGEEGRSLGGQYADYLQQEFQYGFEKIAAAIEEDLAQLYKYTSRAYGTAGTTPFASALGAAAQVRKILDDNGCPAGDRALVVNTAAGAAMRSLSNLNADYAAGTTETLRQGTLLPLMDLDIKESAQIQAHTAGTGASATTDTAGYSIGDTTITLASAGTGTILTGDVITFAGDDNKYVVLTGDADVSGGGTIVLAAPGLKQAIAASATAITVVKDATDLNYTANMAFHRSSIVLAARKPIGGDAAVDETEVTDPLTGLTFRVARYPQYMRNKIEIQLLWGVKLIKPAHTALLLG